jgi:hypothetical protein
MKTRGTCLPPATLNEVLHAEICKLRPACLAGLDPSKFHATPKERAENLREIYRRVNKLGDIDPACRASASPLAALCLSGGGIRSATFNLGVIQCLAKIGLLGRFDYLSSVSGGGYIAGWLRAWMYRAGIDKVVESLGRPDPKRDAIDPEPTPLVALREFSNYLTPRLGLFSGDTWAALAIILRNLILNWLVLIPLLSAVIGIPLLFLLVVRSTGFPAAWESWLLGGALLLELLASLTLYDARRFAKIPGTPQLYFILRCVLPVCLAASVLSTAGLSLAQTWQDQSPTDKTDLWQFSALWCIAIPFIGWSCAEMRARLSRKQPQMEGDLPQSIHGDEARSVSADARQVSPKWEFVALLISGLIGTGLLAGLTQSCFSYLYKHPALYVVLVLPMLLGIYLFARVVFVGVASLSESTRGRPLAGSSDDADREWWARLSGWIMLVAIGWVVVTGICVLGSHIPEAVARMIPVHDDKSSAALVSGVKWLVGALGGLSGITAALTGSSDRTPAAGATRTTPVSRATRRLLIVAGPLFVICVLITLSWVIEAFGQVIIGAPDLFKLQSDFGRDPQALSWRVCVEFFGVLTALGALAIGAGRVVNVNRFSLHGLYRNRLVRAYLGASNSLGIAGRERKPDPFTGFALDDNLPLHRLWPVANPPPTGARTDASAADCRLMPIINTTLNLVRGENLAWQQRKAESFSMTPLFCGNLNEGYRPASEYGGPDGITVGTAVTVSGAAANPNMGYNSSPALSFLMAIFNVRLGAWLGNTNLRGDPNYWKRAGPRQAIMPLFAEIFGLTNSKRHYVNLSDGGHFDNLGLYEVVLRRCRYVLVSDAGQDRSFAFKDLGNAIRKVRIDFGIDIVFTDKIKILPNEPEQKGLYCAIGSIRYSEVDGTSPERDGVLIYIKPTLQGEGTQMPYDIYSYARSNSNFPHESTVDQWFSESQFESYRALGFHIVEQLCVGLVDASFKDFHKNVDHYIQGAAPPIRAVDRGDDHRKCPDAGTGE